MTISESESIENKGARMEAVGNLSLTAPEIRNENNAFSAKRVLGETKTNPTLIQIDQSGHPEKGEAFPESEFSSLKSGYGALHDGGNKDEKEPLEEAKYIQLIKEDVEESKAEAAQSDDPDEKPLTEDMIGQWEPTYDYDDPVFDQFGLTSMTTPRPDYGDPNQKTWDDQYKIILQTLNEKILAYNQEVEAYNQNLNTAAKNKIKDYTIIRTNTTESHEEIATSHEGNIQSGGNMDITGTLLNEDSRIAAGETMTIHGDLDNKETKNQVIRVTFGTTQQSYTKKKKWPHKAHRRHYGKEIFMTPAIAKDNPASLGIDAIEEQSEERPSYESIAKTARDNVQNDLDPFASANSGNKGHVTTKTGQWSAFTLPENSLYHLNPDSTAGYLIETDPAFTNKKKFLSSDYMYDQLRWDPGHIMKKLGDGFYEQFLLREQIYSLTGKEKLNDYGSDEEEFKTLMDSGIAYAREMNLTPGIALTKEQIAVLTSDIIWLEETDVTIAGKTYKVLYPHVYLRNNGDMKLDKEGNIISAKNLVIDAKNEIKNEGTLQGDTIILNSRDIENTGNITGSSVDLSALNDIHQDGMITGGDKVSLKAGKDISMDETMDHYAHQDVLNTTAGIAVNGKEGVLLMDAGKDINLTGAVITNLGENGSTILKAGNTISLKTDTLSSSKDMTENKDNYLRTYNKTETGNIITSNGNLTLAAGNNLNARNSTFTSEQRKVTLAAGNDVILTNGEKEARKEYGIKYKEKGLLSGKTTVHQYDLGAKNAQSTLVSGEEVALAAGNNLTLTASDIVGEKDVSLTAGKNISIESEEESSKDFDYNKTKKTGLLGGCIGFTIGSEKKKDTYTSTSRTQKESLIGSTKGNVTIQSNDKVDIQSSDIISAGDTIISSKDVTISGKDNVYINNETHEYSRSGLPVSLGGATIEAVKNIAEPIKRAGEVKDSRLKTLYGIESAQKLKTVSDGVKAGKNLADSYLYNGYISSSYREKWDNYQNADRVKAETPGTRKSLAVDISLGKSKSSSTSESITHEFKGSSLIAKGDTIITSENDTTIRGSTVSAKDILIHAGKDLKILSGENRNTTNEKGHSSGASIGASVGSMGLRGVTASFSKGKDDIKENEITHTMSQIQVEDNVALSSGKNTAIKGGKVTGNRVTADIGDNLTLESEQDTRQYNEKGKSTGINLGSDPKGHVNGMLHAGKSKTDSNYSSVTDQTAIFAGKDGFDIAVDKETTLKGAVISSKAEQDKNKLTTGTLTYSDIQNKAEYKADGKGVSYGKGDSIPLNVKGLTPDLAPMVKGKAGSVTKSAISKSDIVITNPLKQKQDIGKISTETNNSLNVLTEIFNSKNVKERQELIQELNVLGNEAIHDIAVKKGWKDGSAEKAALHGMLGALTSEMSGGTLIGGAATGSLSEFTAGYIEKKKGKEWVLKHPDILEMSGVLLGTLVSYVMKKDIDEAYAALSAVKWNHLYKEEQENVNRIFDKEVSTTELDAYELLLTLDDYIGLSIIHKYVETYPNYSAETGILENNGIPVYILPEIPVYANGPNYIDILRYNQVVNKYGLKHYWNRKQTVQENLEAMAFDIDQKYFYGHTVFQSPWAERVGFGLSVIGEMNFPTLSPLATSLNNGLEFSDLVTTDDKGKTFAGALGGIAGAKAATKGVVFYNGGTITLPMAFLIGLSGYEGTNITKYTYSKIEAYVNKLMSSKRDSFNMIEFEDKLQKTYPVND